MALVLSCETTGSIRVLGIVYKYFSADIIFLCMLPRALAMSTKSGSTFHPLALMSSIKPLYFIIFSSILSSEYLSLQYANSKNCTIYAFVMMGFVQKLLEIFLSICRSFIHLLMLSNVLANSSLLFFSTFSKYDFRCLIGPLYRWSSSLHHQYGVELVFSCGWVDISFPRSILLPSFANLSASSLSMTLVCALILCRVVEVA
jgi:hypothetical protein